MLQKLSIQNYALIEDVKLNLTNGFTTITGETGAGKSIILGAVGLLLGKRADLSAIKDTSLKCIIEAEFLIANYHIESLFTQLELDYDSHTIIRREILPSGKSRLFINDTPVKLAQGQALGKHLVDIHSQHDTLSITHQDYQYQVLDVIADSEKERHIYQEAYKHLSKLELELKQLKIDQAEAQKTYDYNLFLLEELDAIKLESIDQEELEQQKNKLDNTEFLKEKIGNSYQQLSNEDIGLTNQLRQLQIELKAAAQIDANLSIYLNRVNSALIELEDIQEELDSYLDSVEDDPELKTQIDEKLSELYRLQTKHQTDDLKELIATRDQLQFQIEASQNANQNLDALLAQIEVAEQQLEVAAKALFKKRQSITKSISEFIKESLTHLGMPNAKFNIEGQFTEDYSKRGADDFRWLFTANKGSELQPIAKVASGGELSRITLALKSLLSQKKQLPSLILDEIDTGVSGEIATKMGDLMQEMGGRMQLIAITHLPQIASKGKEHLKVYKSQINQRTVSQIKTLSVNERIDELAEMLGGKSSSSAVSHAKTLLNQ